MTDEIDSLKPGPSTDWQLWHSDTFDMDSQPSLQSSGTTIMQGLYELWLYTLNEAVFDNGSASFSRFQLTWGSRVLTRVDIAVNPFNNLSLTKLRRWANLMSQNENREEPNHSLLSRLAQLHYELLQNSSRWKASAIEWSAESKELLARVELITDPKEL